MFLQYPRATHRNVSYANIHNKHPSEKSESEILTGGMETRKTNRFWEPRARAAEGKPVYQRRRVKCITKIKSSSEKLKLHKNEEKIRGQKSNSPTHGWANPASSRLRRGKKTPEGRCGQDMTRIMRGTIKTR